MSDVVTMIRGDMTRKQEQADQIRVDYPICTKMIDEFRAVFGKGVKPKYFSEGGKTMGKQIEFEGTDINQIIRLDEMDAKRRKKAR